MQISDAESVVMDVLWKRSPLSADEVVAALSGQREWQDAHGENACSTGC
jgi:predicted transcriptional regulator